MNLIITTRCNKNCSFCFARERNQSDEQDMSYSNFLKVLDFVKRSRLAGNFQILGGEPTVHPQFPEFIDEIIKRKLHFNLITNGLYTDKKIRDSILRAAETMYFRGALMNASELNTGNRLQVFKENHASCMNLAVNRDNFFITCGITLNRNKSVKEEIDYVEWLLNNLDIVEDLRISIDFLGSMDKLDTSFINNKDYGKKIISIMDICLKRHIPIVGDCKIFPCMFENQFIVNKKLKGLFKILQYTCRPETVPLDVAPDLSYYHCYPFYIFGGKSILDYNNLMELEKNIIFRKKAILNSRVIPDECRKCTYFSRGICDSLCLGCQHISTNPLLFTDWSKS